MFCSCEGLKEGDRIIEVNGVNVECDFHVECAAKIQSVIGQVKLLVVDAEADAYFQQRQMPMSSKQPYVSRHTCPTRNLPGLVGRCNHFNKHFNIHSFNA